MPRNAQRTVRRHLGEFKNEENVAPPLRLLHRYEEEATADGIKGTYFDNPTLEGHPRVVRVDRNIDFSFGGSGPLSDLKVHRYSIRKTSSGYH